MHRSQSLHGSTGTGGAVPSSRSQGSGTAPSGSGSRVATTPSTIQEPAPGA